MISEQAKQGVNLMFTRAAKISLAVEPSDRVDIEQLRGPQIIETPENRILVLTVASYVFRLLTIFHVNNDKTTGNYFTKRNPERTFEEAFNEIGNLCCGAMNRELGNFFLHTGMSTPYLLDSKCIPFLTELKPTYVSQHRIGINNTVVMHATLCLCAYAPIDFHVDTETVPEETGALEFF
jgi:hypothetical protein